MLIQEIIIPQNPHKGILEFKVLKYCETDPDNTIVEMRMILGSPREPEGLFRIVMTGTIAYYLSSKLQAAVIDEL